MRAASVAPVRELTPDEQARQALARLTFGARPGDVRRVEAMGVHRWIARQLEPERIDDAATERFVARFPVLRDDVPRLLADYPPPQLLSVRRRRTLRAAARRSREVLTQLQTAKVARAVMSRRQLQEVMVDFWENHFSLFAGKGLERYLLPGFERDAIRPYALGHFRDLLGAVAKSPAMLYYLDNWRSAVEPGRPALVAARRPAQPLPQRAGPARARSRGLNENYGRELMELHTIGVDGGYRQHDVVDVARAFTGWTITPPRMGSRFVFRPAMHDADPKTVLGHPLTAGRGMADGKEVLDILARSPATAHHIALELAQRFVSDSPPPALVDRAAAVFLRTDGDIRETLRTIVTSSEFFSRAAYRSKVKSPFELVVSTARWLGAPPDSTARTAQVVARLGEPIFGHRAPNGYPERSSAWIDAGSLLERIDFGIFVAHGRFPGLPLSRVQRTSGLAPHALALALGSPDFQRR